jgi:hypothetical protein
MCGVLPILVTRAGIPPILSQAVSRFAETG